MLRQLLVQNAFGIDVVLRARRMRVDRRGLPPSDLDFQTHRERGGTPHTLGLGVGFGICTCKGRGYSAYEELV